MTGSATSGDQAMALSRDVGFDVVVLDYSMPDRNGIEIAAAMLAERPQQHVALCSAYLNADVQASAAALGVEFCVEKDLFITDRHACSAPSADPAHLVVV